MKTKTLFYVLILIGAFSLFSCSQPEPEPFSSFTGHEFNDLLSSLDTLNDSDTLILGTENGKLIFYNTANAENYQVDVGSDKVYFVYQTTLPDSNSTKATFVGVRNEGLKMYLNNDFQAPPKIFIYGEKGIHYSVYKVIPFGNKILCSTSNGIAELELKDMVSMGDSIKIIYPKLPNDSVPADYKITAMVASNDQLFIAQRLEKPIMRPPGHHP